MKDMVLNYNAHAFHERVAAFLNKGKSNRLTPNDLSWVGHKLFLHPAPEPNDVDWEFVHVPTI